MTRPRSLLNATSLTLAVLSAFAAAQVGCDLVRGGDDKNDKPLTRERGGDPPKGPVNPGAEPALIVAARAGDAKEVRRLAKSGADLNAFGNDRQTALIAAARGGHRDVVGVLLEAGADANLRDAKGNTAAEAAEATGHPRIAESIRKAEVKPPSGPATPVAAPKPQPEKVRQ
jgi:ankyrin repeat protein